MIELFALLYPDYFIKAFARLSFGGRLGIEFGFGSAQGAGNCDVIAVERISGGGESGLVGMC